MSAKLAIHARVVHALILREIKTRFGREQIGYIWAVIEPMLYVSIFFVLYKLTGRSNASGMPITLFLLTGAMPFVIFRNTLQRSMVAIQSNRPLLTFPQVTPLHLVIARALLEMATTTVAFILLVIAIASATGPVRIEDPLGVLLPFLLMGLFGFGAGAAFGALLPLFPSIGQIVPTVLLRPLFFMSGLFFTAEMLPEHLRNIAIVNPLLQMTGMIRSAFFYEYDSAYTDISYVLLFTLVVLCVGMMMQRALRKRILSLPP